LTPGRRKHKVITLCPLLGCDHPLTLVLIADSDWLLAVMRMENGIYRLMLGILEYDHSTLTNNFLGQALEELGVSYKEDPVARNQKALDLLEASTKEERQAILDAKKAQHAKERKILLRRINSVGEPQGDSHLFIARL